MSLDPRTAVRFASVFEHYVVCGYPAASESLDALMIIMAAEAQPSQSADEAPESVEGEEPASAALDINGSVH